MAFDKQNENFHENLIINFYENKEIMYYGTNLTRAKSILSQGLLPNTKETGQGWESKIPPLPGIYLTPDFELAADAALSVLNITGSYPVIFIVQLELRSPSVSLINFKDFQQIDLSQYPFDENYYRKRFEIVNEAFQKQYKQKLPESLYKLYRDYLDSRYEISAILGGYYENDDVDIELLKYDHFILQNELTRKLHKFVDELALRVDTPITFRGSNRILGAVVFKPTGWEMLYGTKNVLPEDFIDHFPFIIEAVEEYFTMKKNSNVSDTLYKIACFLRSSNIEKTAIIKKCLKKDLDPKRSLSQQIWCLYSHKDRKLLGRHPTKESAREQEKAVYANK